jgi:predicted kinase
MREAARVGKTYNEVFSDYSSTAMDILISQLKGCAQKNLDFVLDMTNCDEASRKQKLQHLPSHVKKIAIYFPSYTVDVLEARIKKRAEKNGHSVPREGIEKLHAKFRIPQKTEGFDLVVSSSHFVDILKVMKWQ